LHIRRVNKLYKSPAVLTRARAKRERAHEVSWFPPETGPLDSHPLFTVTDFGCSCCPDVTLGVERRIWQRTSGKQRDHARLCDEYRQANRHDFSSHGFRHRIQFRWSQSPYRNCPTTKHNVIGLFWPADSGNYQWQSDHFIFGFLGRQEHGSLGGRHRCPVWDWLSGRLFDSTYKH
jgi:hypothetical protein